MRNVEILLLRRGTFNDDKLDAGNIGPGHTATATTYFALIFLAEADLLDSWVK